MDLFQCLLLATCIGAYALDWAYRLGWLVPPSSRPARGERRSRRSRRAHRHRPRPGTPPASANGHRAPVDDAFGDAHPRY